MKFREIFFFVSILFGSIYSDGFGQSIFIDALVITNQGDSLQGKVSFNDWNKTPSKLDFYKTNIDSTYSLFPSDVDYLETELGKFFSRTVMIDAPRMVSSTSITTSPEKKEATVFLKAEILGVISLYTHQNKRLHFFIKEDGGEIYELNPEKYIVEKDGEKFTVERRGINTYKNQLDRISRSCNSEEINRVDFSINSIKSYLLKCYIETKEKGVIFVSKEEKIQRKGGVFVSLGTEFLGIKERRNTDRYDDKVGELNTTNVTLGFQLKYIFKKDLNRNALLLQLTTSKIDFEEERLKGFSLLTFKVIYERKLRPNLFSPFVRIGGVTSKSYLNRDEGDSFPGPRIFIGGHVGIGVNLSKFYAYALAESRNRSGERSYYRSIALSIGYDF